MGVLCLCMRGMVCACVAACVCVKLFGIVTSGNKNRQKGYKRTILMTKMRKNLNLKVTVIISCAVQKPNSS